MAFSDDAYHLAMPVLRRHAVAAAWSIRSRPWPAAHFEN
jgi:hypothetical protein